MRTCYPHPTKEYDKNGSRGGEQSSISKGRGEYFTTKGGDYYFSDLHQFYTIMMPAKKQRVWDPYATNDQALLPIEIMYE